MFKYKDFEIERIDSMNLGLFQWQSVPVYEKGESGAPRKTTEVRQEKCRLGFYSTFSSAIAAMIDKCIEGCHDVKELSTMLKEIKSNFTKWNEKTP